MDTKFSLAYISDECLGRDSHIKVTGMLVV